MSWPILLTEGQSRAVVREVERFVADLPAGKGATRAQIAIVLSQMARGIALDPDEQELLRHILLIQARDLGQDEELERAFFRLFGSWPIDPPYWHGTLRMRT